MLAIISTTRPIVEVRTLESSTMKSVKNIDWNIFLSLLAPLRLLGFANNHRLFHQQPQVHLSCMTLVQGQQSGSSDLAYLYDRGPARTINQSIHCNITEIHDLIHRNTSNLHVCVYVYTQAWMHVCNCMRRCMDGCMHACMYTYEMHLFVCMHACTHGCMYIYICIHAWMYAYSRLVCI